MPKMRTRMVCDRLIHSLQVRQGMEEESCGGLGLLRAERI